MWLHKGLLFFLKIALAQAKHLLVECLLQAVEEACGPVPAYSILGEFAHRQTQLFFLEQMPIVYLFLSQPIANLKGFPNRQAQVYHLSRNADIFPIRNESQKDALMFLHI